MKLDSSFLAAVTHYGSRRELHVVFKSGRKVVYTNVEERVFLELALAASPGRYYTEEIRGAYASRKDVEK